MHPPDEYNATLARRREIAEGLALFWFAPDSGVTPAFEPGQFTNLGLHQSGEERMLKRAFSIASAPDPAQPHEVYIRLVDGGRFTTPLWKMAAGEKLWMDTRVFGHFTLAEVPPEKDLILIGSGTGVAPYVSMLRKYAGTGRWRRCVMIESVRVQDELGYRSELAELAARVRDFVYLPTLTREPAGSDWRGARGRVQDLLEPAAFERATGVALAAESCKVFLCGNPAMIEAVGGLLSERGFLPHRKRAPGQIHTETYW